MGLMMIPAPRVATAVQILGVVAGSLEIGLLFVGREIVRRFNEIDRSQSTDVERSVPGGGANRLYIVNLTEK